MDRNSMNLTEAEDIKKKWQQYTELYKKGLNDQDNQNGVITHLETNILECEDKWALGSIPTNKASGIDRIPGELLQILTDDADKSATLNMPANLYNSTVATGLEKSVSIPVTKKEQCQRMFKLPHSLTHFTC